MPETVQCSVCGTPFEASPTGRRLYCSGACRAKACRGRGERTCSTCGKTFHRPLSNAATHCSRACYEAGRQRTPGQCQVCGNPLKVNATRFCSPECFKVGIKRGETRPCQQCGKSMYVEPALQGSKRFCSNECRGKASQIDGPGHTCKRSDGYMQVYYPTHPDAMNTGMVLEHRLVAEKMIGRRLTRNEHVHHRNGVRDDNRPENLEVIDAGIHGRISIAQGVKKRQRMRDQLAEYRRLYGDLPEPKE